MITSEMTTPRRLMPGLKARLPMLATLGLVAGLTAPVAAEHGGLNQNHVGDPVVDPSIVNYISKNGISGKMNITGSNTMRPMMSKLAAQFMSLHPGTEIHVEGVGSSAALREFQLGISHQRRGDKARGKGTAGSNKVELLSSSRPLTNDELEGVESSHGTRPAEIPVAKDAVAIYVNRDNPVRQLTMAEVDAIFGEKPRSGRSPITTWGQVGVEGPLANQPINLYGRNKESGTRLFFMHVALKGGDLRSTVLEQPGSASEIIAISRDPLAIGYAGTGFHIDSVRAVPIVPEKGQKAEVPDEASVISGEYPLARSLYLYVKRDSNDPLEDGLVKEFMSFVNSRQEDAVSVCGPRWIRMWRR